MTQSDLTRPIIGIENRTAQEVFDIMCDRIHRASPTYGSGPVAWRVSTYLHGESGWKFTADPATAHYWADTSGTVAEPLYTFPVKQPVGEVTRESVIEECARVVDTGAGWIGAYHKTPSVGMAPLIATAIRALASNPPEAPTVEADKQKVREWTQAHFYKMPANLTGDELIEVQLASGGAAAAPRPAKDWFWDHCDIVAYRLASLPPGGQKP